MKYIISIIIMLFCACAINYPTNNDLEGYYFIIGRWYRISSNPDYIWEFLVFNKNHDMYQYLNNNDHILLYKWKFIIYRDTIYKTVNEHYWLAGAPRMVGDTLFIERTYHCSKLLPFGATGLPNTWPDSIVEVNMDSVHIQSEEWLSANTYIKKL